MAQEFTRRVNIYVNSGDAEKAYEKLEKSNARLTASEDRLIQKTKQLEQTLAGIDKNADPKAFRKATKDLEDMSKALDANRQAQAKNKAEMDTVQKKMSGEISASYNDMAKTVRRLSTELKNMSTNDVNFGSKLAELKQAKAEMNKFEEAINGGKSAYMSMFKDIKSVAIGTIVAGGLTGVAAAAGGLLTGSADAAIEREKKRRELQAITGVAEEELGVLDQYASELSRIELESGKAFNTSTNDIYEAFKLVGSAKPELLSNIDALKATTKEVLVLSKASGLDLSQSTRAVTSILNQFNMGAGESRRVINALAAGAKEGAKEIPWLTDAFEKVGPIAANSNMSIEQTAAALEVLGLSYSEPAEAATGLKNVILELQMQGFGKMADGSFNYAKAMNQVNESLHSNVDIINVFKKEGAVAALIAKNNTDEYNRLSKSISNTNSAYEQASIVTNPLEERQKEFSKALNNTATIIGQRLTPVMLWLYDAGMKVMGMVRNAPQLWEQYKLVALGVVAVIAQYNMQLILLNATKARALVVSAASTVAEVAGNVVGTIRNGIVGTANLLYAVYTGNVSRATAMQILFNGAMSTLIFPLTALVGLFYAVKKGLDLYNSSSEASIQLIKQKKQFSTDFTKIMKDNEIAYAGVNKQIENFNNLSELEQKALEKKIATERILMMDKVNTLKRQRGAMEKNAEKEEDNSFSGTFGQVLLPGYYTNEKLKKNKEEARLAVRNNYDAQIKEAEQGLKQWSDSMSQIEAQKASKNISASGGGAVGAGEKGSKPKITKDDIEKEEDNWNKRMQELRDEYYLANLTDDERELARIDTKYNKLVKEVDSNEKLLADTKRRYISELRNLEKTEKESTQNNIDYKAALAANDTYHEGLKQKAEESYALGTITHEQYTHEIEMLDISLLAARVNIANQYQDKAKQACTDLTKIEKDEHKKRVDDLKNATERKIKAEEELKERVEKFNLDQASYIASKTKNNNKDDVQAEINQIKYKYDKQREAALKGSKDIETIEKERAEKLKGVTDKDAITLINAKYQNEIDIANTTKDKLVQIKKEEQSDIDKVVEKGIQTDKEAGLAKLEAAKQVADGVMQIMNGIVSIMGANSEADLKREQKNNDAKKKHYAVMLKSKRITQEQHDQLVQESDEAMAKKQAAIKKKQFEAEKMARAIGVIIDTAAAVAKSVMMFPLSGGMPWAAINAAIGAVQLGIVMAQPTPEFREGENFGNNQLLKGPSHEAGGMAVLDGKGRKVAEFEGDELLLGRKFAENNPQWVDPLLQLGRIGGRMEDLLPMPTVPNFTLPALSVPMPSVSPKRVQENIVKYREGANFGTAVAVKEAPSTPTKTEEKAIENSVFNEILKELREIKESTSTYKIKYDELALELGRVFEKMKTFK